MSDGLPSLPSLSYPSALARVYYPPPPWLLRGSAVIASFLVQAAAVQPFVPAPLSLVRLPGNLATGYLGVARYGPGSTLEYSELVAGVLVRHRWRVGPYVTHVGVDTQPAQRAGRELWYLPRQLWRFEWELDQPDISLRIWDGLRLVCTLSGIPHRPHLFPLRTSVTFLNLRGTDVATMRGDFNLRLARVPWQLQIGPDGPLAPLAPAGRLLTAVVKAVVDVHGLQVEGTPQE